MFHERTKDQLIITDPFGVTQKTRQREREKERQEKKCIYLWMVVSAMQKLKGSNVKRGRSKCVTFNREGSDMSLIR